MPIDRGEQSTVSTDHRLAIVVMASAGLTSYGRPLAWDGATRTASYFHAGAMNGGCQAKHVTSASGQTATWLRRPGVAAAPPQPDIRRADKKGLDLADRITEAMRTGVGGSRKKTRLELAPTPDPSPPLTTLVGGRGEASLAAHAFEPL